MNSWLCCGERIGGRQPIGKMRASVCEVKQTGGSGLQQCEKVKRRASASEYNWENILK